MKIAIVKLSALGDIVHAMVALQFIKEQFPEAQIDWIVEGNLSELLRHNPHIHEIVELNLKALKQHKCAVFQEIRRLRNLAKRNYDLVIDAQGLIKSAITSYFLGKRRIGFDRYSIRESLAASFYTETVNIAYSANTIDRNVRVITEALGLHIETEQILSKQAFLFYAPPSSALDDLFSKQLRNVVYVCGSTWPSRNYPIEHFLTVIQELGQQALITWGNETEYQSASWLAGHSPLVKITPKLNLNDLKALIARADLVIGNDTGPTHMAWGLNRPSITLFGPTPVSRVYQTPINKVLKSPSEVNPYRLNKQDFSIAEIPPSKVIELAKSLLAA